MNRILLITLGLFFSSMSFSNEMKVWFWNLDCASSHKIKISVFVEEENIFIGSAPVCLKKRSEVIEDKGKFEFAYVPNIDLKWNGYRDEETQIKAGEEAEFDIWIAGSESDGFLLGVSVMTSTDIHMNTIHFAEVGKENISKLSQQVKLTTLFVQ